MLLTTQALRGYPELQAALVQLTAKAADDARDWLTYAESKAIVIAAAPVFIDIVRQYDQLTGEQKKALVDACLTELALSIEPFIRDSVMRIASAMLPWYVAWIPWVLSYLVDVGVIDHIIKQIPAMSQSVYDGLKRLWTKKQGE